MNNRLFRWSVRLLAAALLSLVAGVTLIVGTDTGTRWLLDTGRPYLPPALELGPVQGSLLRGITIESLRWRTASAHIEVNGLSFDIELRPLFRRNVVIRSLVAQGVVAVLVPAESADSEAGELAVDLPVGLAIRDALIRSMDITRGDFERRIDSVDFAAKLEGPALDIERFRLASSWLTLGVQGRLRLAPAYRADLAIDWRLRDLAERNFAGRLRVDGNANGFSVEHALIEPVALASEGTLRLESGMPVFDLVNSWRELELQVDGRRLVSPEGSLVLRGNPAAFSVELQAEAGTDDLPVSTLHLVGEATREDLQFSQLTIGNEFGELSASGKASWLPRRYAEFDVAITGVDPSLGSPRLSGRVAAEGHVAASFDDSGPVLEARIDTLSGVINDQPLGGGGELAFRNATLSFSGVELAVGQSRLRAAGAFGAQVRVDGDFDFPALAEIDPSLSGSLTGEVAVSGARARPAITLALLGERLARGSLAIGSARAALSGYVDDHDLSLALQSDHGRLEVEADGGFVNGAWAGYLQFVAMTAGEFGTWSSDSPARLRVGAEHVELSELCVHNAANESNSCVRVDHSPASGTDFAASLDNMPLAALPYTLPTGVQAHGVINAQTTARVTESGISGNGEIRLVEAGLDADYDGEPIVIDLSDAFAEFSATDNALRASLRVEIAGGGGNAQLVFELDDMTDAESRIRGDGSLAFTDTSLAAMFAPGISDPQGRIEGRLGVTGTLRRPEFSGEIALREAAFGVIAAGIRIRDFEARLQQSQPGRLRLTGSARSGNGHIEILGDTRLSEQTGLRTDLTVRGADFELVRLPDIQFAASPDIAIVLDQSAAQVTGKLRVPHAVIKVKSLPTAAARTSPDAVVHRETAAAPPVYRRVDINVTTELGDDVRLSGFGLTTGLEGSVRIEGGTHRPYLGFGRLSTLGGRYKAYGQDLTIERGVLIFNGPLDNPNLDIRAIRQAGDVVAGIQLSGTPNNLHSEVFSEPSLGDADTLAYLLTGRPLSAAADSGDGDLLNKAAFALGLSQAGTIATQIKTELGLDTLSIEGGTEDSRVVAGKRFGDRLLVEYGYGLIDKLGTLLLRYQLTERLMLESRTGTVSNVDVVYTVRKK